MGQVSGLQTYRLTPAARADVLALYMRLDRESAYKRFGGTMGPAGIERYVARMNFDDNLVIGAYREGQLVGLCEAVELTELVQAEPITELAFAVDTDFRGKQVGVLLGTDVVDALRGQAVALCVVENPQMARLAQKLGFFRASRIKPGVLAPEVFAHLEGPHGIFVGTGRLH